MLEKVTYELMSGILPVTQKEIKHTPIDRAPSSISALPRRYRNLSLKMCKKTEGNAEAFKQVDRWIKGEVDNLFLYGPQGTGKTTIAAAAMQDSPRTNLNYRYIPELMLQFQAAVQDHNELSLVTEVVNFRGLNAKDTAILFDDLAAHRVSDFAVEMLCTVLEKLYSFMATGLIFTSNLSPKQIIDTLGERISSRLCGLALPVKVDGADWRLTARKEPLND